MPESSSQSTVWWICGDCRYQSAYRGCWRLPIRSSAIPWSERSMAAESLTGARTCLSPHPSVRSDQKSAIDRHSCPGHVRGAFSEQKTDGTRDLRGLAQAPLWNECRHLSHHAAIGIEHRRVDNAREQFVDTHLVAGIIVRGGARETMHAMLARGIGGVLRQAAIAEHRGNIDDGAAARGDDGRDLILEPEKYTAQVDADGVVPAIHRQVGELLCSAIDAGVVDGHVQSAECSDGLADGVGHILCIGNIADQDQHVPARRANGGGGLFEHPGATPHHGDLRTSRSQLGGGGGADAGSGPGHEGRTARKLSSCIHARLLVNAWNRSYRAQWFDWPRS